MDEIGSSMVASTIHRFETETGPDGTPWRPSARALREGGQTLSDSGRLRASITHRVGVGGDSVAVGTNVVYAGIHQFGGRTPARTIRARQKQALWWPGAAHPVKAVRHPGSDMPARPFLGLSSGDERAIVAILERHAAEGARDA